MLRADITPTEQQYAHELARSKGMTFKGWLGQLIKRELANSEEGSDAGRRED